MNWDYYRYFINIARSGSLKGAAKKMGVNHTTVGRNITALEEELSTRLFERRSNGFILTYAGQVLFESIQMVEDKIFDAERALSGKDERPEGVIRVAMPGALANQWLVPHLNVFTQKYPKLKLEFLTGASLVNLTRREADLAVRLVEPKQRDLMVKKVGTIDLGLYGHQSLFKGKPSPRKISDLDQFPFIGLYPDATSSAERKILDKIDHVIDVRIRSAAWNTVYSSIKNEVGIGILPEFLLNNELELVPVLKEVKESIGVWLVYHPDLKKAARVRAFIEFISELMKNDF